MARGPTTGRGLDSADQQTLDRLGSDYLSAARASLNQAKALIAENEERALLYSALELRRAFEALVYENALRFTFELTGEDYALWQPQKLLERLIEIDPLADATLNMQMQDPETGEWLSLGTQRRIALPALKKRYHALGNYLHTPVLAQMMKTRRKGRSSLEKVCRDCIELIENDLGASLRLGRMPIFGHTDFTCVECGGSIRQLLNALRTPRNQAPGTKDFIIAKCGSCVASYEIRPGDSAGTLVWREQRWSRHCPYPDCEGVHIKWGREVKDGMISKCGSCRRNAVLTPAYAFSPEGF